jgi:magnesium chelatase subunit I
LELFPEIKKLTKEDEETPYDEITQWFYSSDSIELLDDMNDAYFKEQLDVITPLQKLIDKYHPNYSKEDVYFLKELLLWALSEFKILSKERFTKGFQFNDTLTNYIRGI